MFKQVAFICLYVNNKVLYQICDISNVLICCTQDYMEPWNIFSIIWVFLEAIFSLSWWIFPVSKIRYFKYITHMRGWDKFSEPAKKTKQTLPLELQDICIKHNIFLSAAAQMFCHWRSCSLELQVATRNIFKTELNQEGNTDRHRSQILCEVTNWNKLIRGMCLTKCFFILLTTLGSIWTVSGAQSLWENIFFLLWNVVNTEKKYWQMHKRQRKSKKTGSTIIEIQAKHTPQGQHQKLQQILDSKPCIPHTNIPSINTTRLCEILYFIKIVHFLFRQTPLLPDQPWDGMMDA